MKFLILIALLVCFAVPALAQSDHYTNKWDRYMNGHYGDDPVRETVRDPWADRYSAWHGWSSSKFQNIAIDWLRLDNSTVSQLRSSEPGWMPGYGPLWWMR